MAKKAKKCGYVALLGAPNAGKSTLLNACIGRKITAVSKKEQTTRNKITGIFVIEETQILFLDTPGIQNGQSLALMNQIMNNLAWSSLHEADFVCYLIDLTRGWTEADNFFITKILQLYKKNILFIASKSDKLKKDKLNLVVADMKARYKKLLDSFEIQPSCNIVNSVPFICSAKKKEDVSHLLNFISSYLPENDWLYPADDLTDKSQNFVCAELIREQIFREFGQEIPYKIAVVIDVFQEKHQLVEIAATIVVERESYKSIVIGKNGLKLKQLGIQARQSLEAHLAKKVFLKLFVKVQRGWTENLTLLSKFANL